MPIKIINDFELIRLTKFIIISFNKMALPIIMITIIFAAFDIRLFYNKSGKVLLAKYANILNHILLIDIATMILINKNIAIEDIKLIIISYIFTLILSIVQNQELGIGQQINNYRDDTPINSQEYLLPERKAELGNIIHYINNNNSEEAMVISINGRWGEGKTGIINCIKKEYEDENKSKNNIIWIQPMVVDSNESLIRYFFTRLSSILEESGIYSGTNSYLNKYMKLILEIAGRDSSVIDKFEIFNSNKLNADYRELKESLELDINKVSTISENCSKKILIIIDDFDRIDDENKLSILKFIKEIADFKGLLVIFAMDYENIMDGAISSRYLEKFVSKRFDLKQISEEDILRFYLEKDQFLNMEYENPTLINGLTYLKVNFINIFTDIRADIESYISEQIQKKSEPENNIQIEVNRKDIKANINNPRRIKKTLREIEDMYNIINEKTKSINNNLGLKIFEEKFKSMNLNKWVVRLAFVKIFYEDEFNKILNYGNLADYLKGEEKDIHIEKTNNSIVKNIFKTIPYEDVYGLLNKGEDVARVLDEYFINNYTKSYLTRKEIKREEIIIDMVLKNNIKKQDNLSYTGFSLELIGGIIKSNEANKEELFRRIFLYIEEKAKEGSIEINKLIDGIVIDKNIIPYIGNEYFPFKRLKDIFKENLRGYKNNSEKVENIYNLDDMKRTYIHRSFRYLVPGIILCKKNEIDDIFDVGRLKSEDLITIHGIDGLNVLFKNELSINFNDSSNEITKIDQWSEILINEIKGFSDNELIQVDMLVNGINEIVKDLKEIEEIKDIISKTKVDLSYRYQDKVSYMIDDDLIETLREINLEFKESVIDDVDDIWSFINYFHLCIVSLYKRRKDISIDLMQEISPTIEETYKIIMEKYKSEYKEETLIYTGLAIEGIKKEVG